METNHRDGRIKSWLVLHVSTYRYYTTILIETLSMLSLYTSILYSKYTVVGLHEVCNICCSFPSHIYNNVFLLPSISKYQIICMTHKPDPNTQKYTFLLTSTTSCFSSSSVRKPGLYSELECGSPECERT